NATNQNGAASQACRCGGETTLGGRGGDNGATTGQAGSAGMANDNAAPYPASPNPDDDGVGGRGRDLAACAEGHRGATPAQGATGAGGGATWTLAASGIAASGAGKQGTPGKIGQ